MDSIMHASILVILLEDHETLEVHRSEIDAWKRLIGFVDSRWSHRFGSQIPPEDETTRITAFFKGKGIYLIARADLSQVSREIDEGEQEHLRTEIFRLR